MECPESEIKFAYHSIRAIDNFPFKASLIFNPKKHFRRGADMLKSIKREGLLKLCNVIPFPLIVVDSDYNVVLMNDSARQRFSADGKKCYEVTHRLNRPCWEIYGESICPVKKLISGNEPYAYHEHNSDIHVVVANRVDEDLFIELYLDRYVTDLIRELKFLADVDSLTGLYNRRKIEEILRQEIERAKRYGSPLSILLIDVDNFKQINDTYGHQKGDEVLRKMASLIRAEIRATDAVGRFGGEEFLIVLPQTDHQSALRVAERLRRRMAGTDFGVDRLTVSIGVTSLKGNEDMKTLFARVDRAMYLAKEKGRNRVESL